MTCMEKINFIIKIPETILKVFALFNRIGDVCEKSFTYLYIKRWDFFFWSLNVWEVGVGQIFLKFTLSDC